jgi:hypothetical protein
MPIQRAGEHEDQIVTRQTLFCVIGPSAHLASKPRISLADPCQRRPVTVAFAPRQAAKEVVAHEAGDGHRHVQGLSGGKGQPDVLETELHLEPGRLVILIGDDRVIIIEDREGEEGPGQDLDIAMCVDPRFAARAMASPLNNAQACRGDSLARRSEIPSAA